MSDVTTPRLDELLPVEERITQKKIDLYAELSGDFNPLHVDPEVASRSEFGGTIAHGPLQLQACFRAVCSWIGADAFPPGSSMSVVYRHPARPGDRVRFDVDSDAGDRGDGRVDGQCCNQDSALLAAVSITLPKAAAK